MLDFWISPCLISQGDILISLYWGDATREVAEKLYQGLTKALRIKLEPPFTMAKLGYTAFTVQQWLVCTVNEMCEVKKHSKMQP